MSQLQNDTQKTIADTKQAITVERRRMMARILGWLRGHPRTLVIIVAALTLIAVILGLARG
jgi:hypothetical protein